MSIADLASLWESHSTAIVAVFVLAVVGRIAAQRRMNRARFAEHQAQRRALAASLGLEAPESEADSLSLRGVLAAILVDVAERFGSFPRFRHHPRARMLFEGERDGFRLAVLAHRQTSEYGDEDPATTCALFSSPQLELPEFQLCPAATHLGSADPKIAFAERPRFGELYTLTSRFTVRIRDAFDARALEFFEKHPGWNVDGANGRLLVYREDVEVKPEAMGDFVREATAVAQLFRKTA